jgi:type II restriction enzyme
MKLCKTQIAHGINNEAEALAHFFTTLRSSLTLWDYFVNWDKVFRNTAAVEVHLNTLNYLLGKDDFDSNFLQLLTSNPDVVLAIPTLIVRNGSNSSAFSITLNLEDLGARTLDFDFSKPAKDEASRRLALDFVKGSGLVKLFSKGRVRNLVDYVYGVEAGLDSNGRKNRSGTSMEQVTGRYLKNYCDEKGFEFDSQVTPSKIAAKWGISVPLDKKGRRYDFCIKTPGKLFLFEVNFYGSQGSKLKATAAEYVSLSRNVSNDNTVFVWITDGAGWNTVRNDFKEAFHSIDYVWNLDILRKGVLADICN